MTARIAQINVTYNREEDRLLVRIRSHQDEEYRVWLTRRYTQMLVGAIENLLQGESPVPPDSPQVRAERAFEHEHTTSQADLSTPYEEGAETFPLGEDGVLGYKITVEKKEPPLLHLLPRAGRGITVPAVPRLLHNLHHLLRQASEGAKWALTFGLKPLSADGSRTLN